MLHANNFKKAYVNEPSSKIDVQDNHGRLRVIYDEIEFDANVIALNTILKVAKLPKGAKIYEMVLDCGDLGTVGQIKIGHSASEDGSILADDDAFFGATAVTSAINGQKMSVANVDGKYKKFDKQVDVEVLFSAATDAAQGEKLKIAIMYVVD